MTVWNVGHGLAIHVEAPNGSYVVIDLGSKDSFSPLQTLRWKDVRRMVITHPHEDHIRDIVNIDCARPQMLTRHKRLAENLLENAKGRYGELLTLYRDFSNKYNKSIDSEKDSSEENSLDGLTVNVFAASPEDNECLDINDYSIIVVLRLGNAKIVVCGDNERGSLEQLMRNEQFKEAVRNSWILVAPHHGRESGYCEEFVSLVNPFLTVISDTWKPGETAEKKYESMSRGYNVIDDDTGESSVRKCIQTKFEGNIGIRFGESNDPRYVGFLRVDIHKKRI